MPRIPLSNIEGNVYERLMGHRPEILKAWFNLDATMRFSGALGPELKEEVRRSLAPGVGCVFCASLGTEALTVWADAFWAPNTARPVPPGPWLRSHRFLTSSTGSSRFSRRPPSPLRSSLPAQRTGKRCRRRRLYSVRAPTDSKVVT